jgi:hypothetical protein
MASSHHGSRGCDVRHIPESSDLNLAVFTQARADRLSALSKQSADVTSDAASEYQDRSAARPDVAAGNSDCDENPYKQQGGQQR